MWSDGLQDLGTGLPWTLMKFRFTTRRLHPKDVCVYDPVKSLKEIAASAS